MRFYVRLDPYHKASSVTVFVTEKNVTVLPWKGNQHPQSTLQTVAKEVITSKRQLIETLNST